MSFDYPIVTIVLSNRPWVCTKSLMHCIGSLSRSDYQMLIPGLDRMNCTQSQSLHWFRMFWVSGTAPLLPHVLPRAPHGLASRVINGRLCKLNSKIFKTNPIEEWFRSVQRYMFRFFQEPWQCSASPPLWLLDICTINPLRLRDAKGVMTVMTFDLHNPVPPAAGPPYFFSLNSANIRWKIRDVFLNQSE